MTGVWRCDQLMMIFAIFISAVLVLATALFHYEALRLVSGVTVGAAVDQRRRRVLTVILWIFMIHLVEISAYAFGFWFSDVVVHIGSFTGNRSMELADYFYFSAEAFSTLGLGDVYPIGPLRLLGSIEPIDGLLLIGWSTTFTYYNMQRYWSLDD